MEGEGCNVRGAPTVIDYGISALQWSADSESNQQSNSKKTSLFLWQLFKKGENRIFHLREETKRVRLENYPSLFLLFRIRNSLLVISRILIFRFKSCKCGFTEQTLWFAECFEFYCKNVFRLLAWSSFSNSSKFGVKSWQRRLPSDKSVVDGEDANSESLRCCLGVCVDRLPEILCFP